MAAEVLSILPPEVLSVIIKNKGYTYKVIKNAYEHRLYNRLYISKGRYVVLTADDVEMIKKTIHYSDISSERKGKSKENA